ncbi:MAG: ABC transporter permease, partial [Limnobacter sp.]|nr:ABC transporter permease [Limnobacter sp.]
MSTTAATLNPELKDPAWRGRVLWGGFALLLLWPALDLTNFNIFVFFEEGYLDPAMIFLGDMFPPKFETEFLILVAKESWRTVAIATAGLALAWLVAVPIALCSVRLLSVSALTGKMAVFPAIIRQLVRWVAIVLRSVPELIWALVFVRVVGLGPTSGVIAIGLTYGGMLGKVYADILESGDA